ncbi:hypothetical protein HDU96_004609, partial [Phlyctochytrium bullatum]
IRRGKFEQVKSLVEAGASVKIANCMSWPPLHSALHKEDLRTATFLLDSGADPNERCWMRRTALHALAESRIKNWEKLFVMMVERGVDLNAKDMEGNAALHLAAGNGHMSLLLRLLAAE